MSDESRQGTVSLRTYAAYIRAAGGVIAALMVLIAMFLYEGSIGFSIRWLAHWIDEGRGNTVNVSLLKH